MIWLFALIAAQAGNPTTVNGQELGPAENFKTVGPARVCLENAAVDLVEGEIAYLQYAGIHRGVLRIDAAKGHWEVVHGDSWAKQTRRRLMYTDGETSVYRLHVKGPPSYLFFAPTEYSDGEAAPIASVAGTIMDGSRRDTETLRRISIFRDAPPGCARRYAYGWDMLFGDEPVSQDKQQ